MRKAPLLLAALLAVTGWWAPAPPTQAQSCSPRPSVQVQESRDGTVTLTAATPITQVIFNASSQYAGSLDNVALDLPGQPPALPATINGGYRTVNLNPPSTTYTFHLYTLDYHPVTLPITVADGCGYFQTMAGGGSLIFPTHVPTATATPTPLPTQTGTPPPTQTARPTLTLQPEPTTTPVTVPYVGISQNYVIQGNGFVVEWGGRVAPTTTDYVIITDNKGTAKASPVFTSSCTSTPGSTAKASGACPVRLGVNFPAGAYQVRYYGNNNSQVTLATSSTLNVESTGGALIGRGQLWATNWANYYPDINVQGGWIGYQAVISVGDSGYLTSESWNAVGLTNFALLGQTFVEVGSDKLCTVYPVSGCTAYPYMSWMDNVGDIQNVRWSGGAWPNLPLAINDVMTAKVYELQATRWNGEFCLTLYRCCPLWTGACNGISPEQVPYAPVTWVSRYRWIWAGQETPDPSTAAGTMHVDNAAWCCPLNSNQWQVNECWDTIWDTNFSDRVWTFVSNCLAPGAWDVVKGYR
jgi:cell division septation protein DedD